MINNVIHVAKVSFSKNLIFVEIFLRYEDSICKDPEAEAF